DLYPMVRRRTMTDKARGRLCRSCGQSRPCVRGKENPLPERRAPAGGSREPDAARPIIGRAGGKGGWKTPRTPRDPGGKGVLTHLRCGEVWNRLRGGSRKNQSAAASRHLARQGGALEFQDTRRAHAGGKRNGPRVATRPRGPFRRAGQSGHGTTVFSSALA